ncbi:putative calcium-binding protein CML19 [Ricinus communis]|uniref:putative calcium-binding protein CML19 n=1 Tax=Ricinus communis TaxID=3988 RepID=UPI00201AF0C8|nr:putative calcium-binding protein CML19 [Ricinus communis]
MQSRTLSPSLNHNTHSSPKSPLSRLRRMLSPRTPDQPSLSPPINSTTATSISSELQRVFDYFDENRDGKISAAELQRCVRAVGGELSTEDAEAAVISADTDGDCLLGFEDFQRLMEGSNSEEEKKEELRQAFGMYETEPGSGFISPASLKRMLSRLGDSKSLTDCSQMIRTFDINGDGLLSFHEFSLMMR